MRLTPESTKVDNGSVYIRIKKVAICPAYIEVKTVDI